MKDLQSYLDQALKSVELKDTEEVYVVDEYDIEKEICQLIVSLRSDLGITQKQLAEKSGVSQSNISKIENGSYRPSIAILKRIAGGLNRRLVIEFAEREDDEPHQYYSR